MSIVTPAAIALTGPAFLTNVLTEIIILLSVVTVLVAKSRDS